MGYTEYLGWYWDLVMSSGDALASQSFDEYEFYEEWRRAIKGGCQL